MLQLKKWRKMGKLKLENTVLLGVRESSNTKIFKIKGEEMRKLFLTSSFEEVEKLFVQFINEHFGSIENIKGKKVEIISTASLVEGTDVHVRKAVEIYKRLDFNVEIMELTEHTEEMLKDRIKDTDFLHISGGNTFFLLQEIKKKNLMEFIAERIDSGMIYVGESAGTLITCPDIFYADDVDNKALAPELKSTKGLDIIPFYPLPHYQNEPFTEIVEKTLIKYDCKLKLFPFSNNEVIVVDGEEMDIITLHEM